MIEVLCYHCHDLLLAKTFTTYITFRFENENQPSGEKNNLVRRAPSFSGPLMLPNRASANSLSAPIKSSGGIAEALKDICLSASVSLSQLSYNSIGLLYSL